MNGSNDTIKSYEIAFDAKCSVCREDHTVIALGDADDEWTPSWVCINCITYALSDLGKALRKP